MCLLTIGLTKRRPPKGKVNPSVLLAHQSTHRQTGLVFTRASDDLIWSHSSGDWCCPESRAYIPNNAAVPEDSYQICTRPVEYRHLKMVPFSKAGTGARISLFSHTSPAPARSSSFDQDSSRAASNSNRPDDARR